MALALTWPAVGQHVDRPGLDVVAYYDENDIVKQAYRESPYFLELTGSWKQRATDSSVVYTKKIEAEKSWKDYLVYLNTRCGRACRKGECSYDLKPFQEVSMLALSKEMRRVTFHDCL